MKRSILALSAMAALMAGGAQAQLVDPPLGAAVCPAGDVRTLLDGTYTFQVEGTDPYVYAAIGTFFASPTTPSPRTGNTAALGPNLGSITQITATSIIGSTPNGSPTGISYTRVETEPNASSTYQINVIRDKYKGTNLCPGGSLTLNLSSRPMQYDFYFLPGSAIGEIFLVSTIEGRPATGRAAKSPSMKEGCPVGPNPLIGYAGFSAHGISRFPYGSANYSISGVWSAYAGYPTNSRISPLPPLGNDPYGALDITATSNLGPSGSVTRVEQDFGRWTSPAFSLFPNYGRTACSGSLTFNLSSYPAQFDYWWYGGYNRVVFIGTTSPILGAAQKQ